MDAEQREREARDNVWLWCGDIERTGPEWDAALDAYKAAILARVQGSLAEAFGGYRAAYPADVWPDTPFSEAQAASVLRLMLWRIEAAALATLAETPMTADPLEQQEND